MPASPIDSISQWNHLTGLELADPEYGTPGRVDVLLEADYYGEVLLHGRRCGPLGTPYAQKTFFGWVLAEPLHSKDPRPAAYTCCMLTEDDDSLKKFWDIKDYNTKQSVLSPEERTVLQHFDSTYLIATVDSVFHFRGNRESNYSRNRGHRWRKYTSHSRDH